MRVVAFIAFAFLVIAGTADRAEAQVFKPRGKSAKTTPKKGPVTTPAEADDSPKPKKAAASTKSTKATKTARGSKKKSRAADAGRPSDLVPRRGKDEPEEVASVGGDDEVIITDDDD